MLDADPIYCMRVGGNAVSPIVAAFALGAVFIALTFEWWIATAASAVVTLGAILFWAWTGTAELPEKPEKDVGLGLTLPLYRSGPESVGWWAMFITMVGDGTAFGSLVFGYFFYWTIHEDFTAGIAGPGALWPMIALACFVAAWGLMLAARGLNSRGSAMGMRLAIAMALVLTAAGSLTGLCGPWTYGMQPTTHVYPAIVWILVIWTAVHGAVGIVMLFYCLARSLAGRLTRTHDIDIHNVVLFWHFLTVTAVTTFAVVGLFPLAL